MRILMEEIIITKETIFREEIGVKEERQHFEA